MSIPEYRNTSKSEMTFPLLLVLAPDCGIFAVLKICTI